MVAPLDQQEATAMSQPAIPCPHCGQAVALTPAQTAAALASAKYLRTIAAERKENR